MRNWRRHRGSWPSLFPHSPLRNLPLRRSDPYKSPFILLRSAPYKSAPPASSIDLAAAEIDGVSLNGKRLRGRGHLDLTVCGVHHRLSPGTFYQVNLEIFIEFFGDDEGSEEEF